MWIPLIKRPSMDDLESGVLIRLESQWLHCKWGSFESDAGAPWIFAARASWSITAVLLGLDIRIDGAAHYHPIASDYSTTMHVSDVREWIHMRQELWPAGLLKALRVLRCHPTVLGDPDIDRERIERVGYLPVVAFTWLPRALIVERNPGLLFLLAPSVKLILPTKITRFIATIEGNEKHALPAHSSESELDRYLSPGNYTNVALQHQLGNEIGPYVVSSQLGLGVAPSEKARFSSEMLTGIWKSSKTIDAESTQPDSSRLATLKKTLREYLAELPAGKKVAVYDDDFGCWEHVWKRLLVDSKGKYRVLDGLKLDLDFRECILFIVDLRIVPNDETIPLDQLTGLQFIRALRENERAVKGSYRILAFSSSQRHETERLARDAGADAFLTKPVRFNQFHDSVRLLESLLVFLHPLHGLCDRLTDALKIANPADDQNVRSLTIDLAWEIRRIRHFLPAVIANLEGIGASQLCGLTSQVSPDNLDIIRAIGLAVDACYPASDVSRRGVWGLVIQTFRNLAAHPASEVLIEALRDNSPFVGMVLLLVAVEMIHPTGEYDWSAVAPALMRKPNRHESLIPTSRLLCWGPMQFKKQRIGQRIVDGPVCSAEDWLMATTMAALLLEELIHAHSYTGGLMANESVASPIKQAICDLVDICRRELGPVRADDPRWTNATGDWWQVVKGLGFARLC